MAVINFSTDRLVLATAPEHSLAAIGCLSFSQALAFPHIGLHEDSTLQHFLNRIVAENGQRLHLRIQVRGFESMCRMIEAYVGIGVLPQPAALRHRRTMRLCLGGAE